MSTLKAKAVEYKGKEYSVEEFVEIVRHMNKNEILNIVSNNQYTQLIANYIKEHPECLEKSGATVATKK